VNWGNYDLVVIDESHNFRNNDIYKDKETRYQKLMNQVIREGVKTKVLMLSATPVNNRFTDLRNQLALAYEGRSEALSAKLKTSKSIEEIFRRAQAAFNRGPSVRRRSGRRRRSCRLSTSISLSYWIASPSRVLENTSRRSTTQVKSANSPTVASHCPFIVR
jgi:hypothetical protein